MRPYAVTKSAGSPWLDEVPAHWTVSRFRYEAVINGGQVDPREEPWSGMTLIAPNHIESNTGRVVGIESAEEQGADSGKYLVEAGQLVYSKIRPALNKVAIAETQALCSADMYAMSFSDRVDPRFALYYFLARPLHTFATVISMRVKMPKINREELSEAPWLVPPIPEQRAIADYLDRETVRSDTLIEEQQRLIEMLCDRRRSLASGIIGARVGHGDRLKWLFDDVDIRSGAEAETLPLLSVSISWGVRRRDEVTDDASRAEDLSHYKVCRRGDLVINRMRAFQGGLGLATEDGIVSPDYAVLRPRSEVVGPWLAAAMKTDAFVSEMTRRVKGIGSTDLGNARTPRINISDLGGIRLDVPSRDMQLSEVAHLDDQTAKIARLIAETERFIDLSHERRAALITAAVTGQIDVREEVA